MREDPEPGINRAVRERPALQSRDYMLETMTFLATILRNSLMKCFPDYICKQVFVARVKADEFTVIPISPQGVKYQDVYTEILSCRLQDSQAPVVDRKFHIVEGRFGIIVFKMIRINPNEYLVGYEMERKPLMSMIDESNDSSDLYPSGQSGCADQ